MSRGRMPGWLVAAGVVAGVALAGWLALLALIWWQQERLLFQPQRLHPDHRFAAEADVHETWVEVEGARLNALHLRLPSPRGVVFFLHGNGGSLQEWFVNTDFYRRANFDLFMLDYRGYGKSSGSISSQAQLDADVLAAWRSIAPRYAGLQRVVYGRSLGTGLAATLAAQVQPELTVLVSPYESMSALARRHYPWVPTALLRYPLRTDLTLPKIQRRVLIVQGGRDTLIPPENAHALRRLVPQAQWLWLPEAGHADVHQFPDYLEGLAGALAAGPGRGSAAASSAPTR